MPERQAIALGHVLEHGALTIQKLEALCEGVNRRSLQRDLKGLLDKGLLLVDGVTNRLTYLAGPNATSLWTWPENTPRGRGLWCSDGCQRSDIGSSETVPETLSGPSGVQLLRKCR